MIALHPLRTWHLKYIYTRIKPCNQKYIKEQPYQFQVCQRRKHVKKKKKSHVSKQKPIVLNALEIKLRLITIT